MRLQRKHGVSSESGLGALAEAVLRQAAEDLEAGVEANTARHVLEMTLCAAGLEHRVRDLATA